jgi:hypothetical protein
MDNAEYVYFELNGVSYRTNGVIVEGLDGSTWNRTNSLRVVLAARDAFKAIPSKPLTDGVSLSDPKFDHLASLDGMCRVWNMCRHCERLIEDVEHKELVHRFMEVTAQKINQRKLYPQQLKPVTADDLEITVSLIARGRTGYDILKEMWE